MPRLSLAKLERRLCAATALPGRGRTYTIGITCTDSSGKPGTKNVFVTVPKNQK